MLDFFKKEQFFVSIADGSITNLSFVPDEVFSQKILGDGFAVFPSCNTFVSPADGIISDVTKTLHAYCITTDDGLEVLVHIGLDTVELGGSGFVSKVKPGDKIKKGEPLAVADLAAIEAAGYSTVSMVVVTNSDQLRTLNVVENPAAKAGEKAALYKI